LIDSFSVADPYDRGQQTIFTLANPQTDDEAQANPDDPDISDSDNGIDPPWRTDPFQNIVNWSGETTTGGLVDYSISIAVTIDSSNDRMILAETSLAGPHNAFLHNTQMNGNTFGNCAGLPIPVSVPGDPGSSYHSSMDSISVSGNAFIVTISWTNSVPPFDVIPGGSVSVPGGPITFSQVANTAFEVTNNYEFCFPFQGPDGIGVVTGTWHSGNLKPTTFNPALGLTHTAIEMFMD
jgi:hypothetical protein